jgi:7-cyano-7-deazaguanine synthase
MNEKKYAVISLSGGMDSSTLLLKLLNENYQITALSFDYDQKHKVELDKAEELVRYINSYFITTDNPKEVLYPYHIKHQIIKLEGLSNLLHSSLVTGGDEVPEGHYGDENMKATVVPNRNKIFASIIQSVALSIAEEQNNECVIAMGIHAGDHAIYPDCRQEFRDADFEAFKLGNWGSEKVSLYTPYLHTDKFGILQDGQKCCEQLDLDFNEIYSRTMTSYKPILIFTGMTYGGPRYIWYSDYKSASSVERIEAFIKLGIPDPASYADENGVVSWDVAVNHVKQIISL